MDSSTPSLFQGMEEAPNSFHHI